MRHILTIIAAVGIFLGLYSCSEKSEQVAAVETANQLEKKDSADMATAAIEGREAAKVIVTKEWKDTAALQRAVLDARAKNSRYEMAGEKRSKAAFDSAFYSTIKTVRPDLEQALHKKK